jgi:hypothetical protein
MFDVSTRETEELADRHRLRAVFRAERGDMLGRPDMHWSLLALQKAD